jgi:hypothetical protein
MSLWCKEKRELKLLLVSLENPQIDIRRANNTEIMLTKIKMPLSDMMVSISLLASASLFLENVQTEHAHLLIE